MEHPSFILYFLIFLTSSLVFVPLFQKLGLGTVLGYLAAGLLIGPFGLGFVKDTESVMHFAEFGVVFLLFIIGLELQPQKILKMKNQLLGLGGAQVFLCTLIFSLLARSFNLSWATSFTIGFALSLSSTAFSLQTLTERKLLNTEFGQASFAVLLMQDILAIPALAIIPNFGFTASTHNSTHWGYAFILIAVLTGMSRWCLSPVFRFIASLRNRELFTAFTLCLVIAVAYGMSQVGLSMALGSFLAGVLLSGSEYRHELEADLSPFKGLLMGLFFISVGMSVNLHFLLEKPLFILGLTFSYMLIKGLILYFIARLRGFKHQGGQNLMIYLVQGGEFAFVLFGVGLQSRLLTSELSQQLTLVVTLSMIISPLILFLDERWQLKQKKQEAEYDKIENQSHPVLIAGFGRFGQIFGRILRAQNIGFTAIDHDSEQIELVRRFGNKVYFGDASRLEILEMAGAKDAQFLVLAIDDPEASTAVAKIVREHFPHIEIFARARNRQHVFELMNLKIQHIRRETFDSSLNLTGELLQKLGFSLEKTQSTLAKFKTHDEMMIHKQFKVRDNEKVFVDVSRQGSEQLAMVLQADDQQKH